MARKKRLQDAKSSVRRERLQKYKGYMMTAEQVRQHKVFDKYVKGRSWKAPIRALVPTMNEAVKLRSAIAFFQADAAQIRKTSNGYLVTSRGYQAW